MALEKILASPLDSNEIKPVNPKGNQPWIFAGRTDAEAPILQPPNVKNRLIGKYPDAGKDWGQGEKGATEDEIAGWHHRLNGHESEQTQADSEGQQSLGSQRVGHDWANEQQQGIKGTAENKTVKEKKKNPASWGYSINEGDRKQNERNILWI